MKKLSITIAPLIAVTALIMACTGKPVSSSEPLQPESHHTASGFRNLYEYDPPTFTDLLKWRWDRMSKDIPAPEDYNFPLAENDPAYLRENRTETTLTWIGHATVLFQTGGKNILTDPQFSDRASPVQWAGPRRVVGPGLALNDLPDIDIVLLSHDHYDSLDTPTVKRLLARPGGSKTLFLVPLNLKSWFERAGVENVIELDWWEEYRTNGMTIIPVPVQHWSKRTPFTRNTTLWAGWVVIDDGFRFFFPGDTGYSPVFKDIDRRLGPFDLSAIPIGAYAPRWFMRHHHVNPEEAVRIHQDVRSKVSVAIHWGTFILTDEPLDEPPERLRAELKKQGIPESDFLVLKHGETIHLSRSLQNASRSALQPGHH